MHHENIPILFWFPETPLLYSKTGVYKGIHYFFLFLLKNIDCGYSLEPPRRGGSNDTHNLSFELKYEKYQGFFLSENVQFLEVKFSIYLNRGLFGVNVTSKDPDEPAEMDV